MNIRWVAISLVFPHADMFAPRHRACLQNMTTSVPGRVLELLLLLEKAWSGELTDPKAKNKKDNRANGRSDTTSYGEGLAIYPLAFLSYVAQSTLEFARSQLEFMNDSVIRRFERQQTNPFMCRCFSAPSIGMASPRVAALQSCRRM